MKHPEEAELLRSVPAEIRRARIVALAREREFVRVADLAEQLGTSEVTIRSDLDRLEGAGALRRVHGGAIADLDDPVRAVTTDARLGPQADAKRAIGRLAATRVDSASTLALQAGTTTLAAAEALAAREDLHDLTVVTNGLHIALELEQSQVPIEIVVVGGTLDRGRHALTDPFGSDMMAELHFDAALLDGEAVDATHGLSSSTARAAERQRALAAAAGRVDVLTLPGDVGRAAMVRSLAAERLSTVLTTAAADADAVAELRDQGVEIACADHPGEMGPTDLDRAADVVPEEGT